MRGPLKLETSGSATADATGTATVTLSVPPWQHWSIGRYSIRSTSTALSSCRLYRGNISDSSFIDGTSGLGNQNVGSIPIDLYPGDNLIAQWTGCTVGASCRIVIAGMYDTP